MADELETLLKIKGDASGAKRAAAETKQAVSETKAAVSELNNANGYVGIGASGSETAKNLRKVSSEVSDAQAQMYMGISKAAGGVEDAGSKARRELEALKVIAGRINPELAMMGEMALRGKEAFAGLFTPIGAAAGGALLAITGLVEAVRHFRQEADEARKAWEAMVAASQRQLAKSAAREESVADVMAKAGKRGDEVVKTASAIEKRMVAAGFKAEAVRAVLPYAVDDQGNQVLDDETIQRLSAQQEFGGDKLGFDRPKEMTGKLRGAMRELSRDQQLAHNRVEAVKDRRSRESERITYGDQSAWAAKLGRMEPGLDEAAMAEAIKDIEQIRTRGVIDTDNYYGSHTEDRLQWEARNREAARRAAALGIITGEEMRKASNRTLLGEEFSPITGAFGGKGSPSRSNPRTGSPSVPAASAPIASDSGRDLQATLQQGLDNIAAQVVGQGRVNHHYHGPVFQNRNPDRFAEHRRVEP